MPWNITREDSRDNPQLSQIPIALPDNSLAKLNGTHIEVYGFSMDTPWQNIYRQKIYKSVSLWNFKEGANFSIMNDSDSYGYARFYRENPQTLRLFGHDAVRSEYALMNAEMYAMPDQVKWWKLPRQNSRAMTLVGLKVILCHNYGTFYAISFGHVHGFQEGAPNVAPYSVELNLFDADDRHYEIKITGHEGEPLPLTQSQINSMVASIQPNPQK
jgi:hypothetical protein